ncbi:unnamed protein product [Danaus chrysippus]|uniref:(African queen) hypothetical protein n=1 Tax=Danaus chrysippus TaxID=151541 RepID=A0A8J2VRS3_9NEOP|nr:unnamed protein product [Danaus chrysippus]
MTEAEKSLRVLLDKILDERDIKSREINVKEIETNGANYTSALFSVKVQTPNEELKLFAKVATIGKEMRAAMNAEWMFDTERFVYNKLAHLYNDIQKDLDDEHKFIFPEYYGCNDEFGKESIVMENLVEHGYKPYNRFKSMDWQHAEASVRNLARFHALSFALEKKDPEMFKKFTDNMEFDMVKKDDPSSKSMFVKMAEKPLEILSNDQRDLVKKFLDQENLMTKYTKPFGRPVLCHGDYRLSNILFKRKGHGLKLKIVDYQTVYAGCPVADLVYFIFLGSDENFRRLFYDNLINHYYKCLQEALERLAVDPMEVYPREKFDSDLKELLPYALVIAVIALPVVTVNPDLAPKMEHNDSSAFVIEPNKLFEERFKGIVNDVIKLGAI